MKIKSKLWLDRVVFGGIVRLLNLLVIPIGKLLNIDHKLDQEFKTIVICKYKGMGSIIQATPLLQAIRKQHPKAQLVFVSVQANAGLLQQIRGIDKFITLDDSSAFSLLINLIPFWWKLFRLRAEVYIDLEVYSNFSSLITILSAAKNRLGFYLTSKHYRLGNYTHMMYYNTRSPISETYLQFAHLLHCQETDFPLARLDRVTGYSYDLRHLVDEDSPYILINPNASDLRIERRWPRAYFAELIGMIQERYPDRQIGLIGSPGEAAYVDELLKLLPNKNLVKALAGKTSFAQLFHLIDTAELLITNDTGPMHIAFANNTPTVALFGPCSPNQYGIAKNAWVIYQNLYCSPCVHEFATPPCRGNNVCMKSVLPPRVFSIVQRALAKEQPTDAGITKSITYQNEDFTVGRLDRN